MSYSFSFLKAECATLRTIVGTNVHVCLLRLDPVLTNRSGSSWWALQLSPFPSIDLLLSSNCYVVTHCMAVRSLFISPRTFSWLQTSATINGAAGDILTLLVCTRGQIRVRSASGSGITGAEKQCGHDCDGERPKTPCPIAPIADTPPPRPRWLVHLALDPRGPQEALCPVSAADLQNPQGVHLGRCTGSSQRDRATDRDGAVLSRPPFG